MLGAAGDGARTCPHTELVGLTRMGILTRNRVGFLDSVFAFEGPELTRQATLETAFWNRDGHLRPNCGRGDVLSHISVLS
jgi:hypothetical protein